MRFLHIYNAPPEELWLPCPKFTFRFREHIWSPLTTGLTLKLRRISAVKNFRCRCADLCTLSCLQVPQFFTFVASSMFTLRNMGLMECVRFSLVELLNPKDSPSQTPAQIYVKEIGINADEERSPRFLPIGLQ